MALAAPLDGKVAGFVHSSSMSAISGFDTRPFKSRHLIVLHRGDVCRVTLPSAGEASHRKFGTELIEMDGGKATGPDCEAFSPPRLQRHRGGDRREDQSLDRRRPIVSPGRSAQERVLGIAVQHHRPTVSKCASRDWICCDSVWMSRKRRSNGVPRKIAEVPAAL